MLAVLAFVSFIGCGERRASLPEPVATREQSLLPSILAPDDSELRFGARVAVQGDTVVVGAPSDYGVAFTFVKNVKDDTWLLDSRLSEQDSQLPTNFGGAVTLSGNTAIVGASGRQVNDQPNQGRAYVFDRNDMGWSGPTELTASDGRAGDALGTAVAISGNRAIIGAPDHAGEGAAYGFVRTDADWKQHEPAFRGDSWPAARFGRSIAISDRAAVVGAPFHDSRGAAYVFPFNESSWGQEVYKLTASDGKVDDLFGYSLAISGDTVIVGAPYVDVNARNRGAAYVFVRTESGWIQWQRLEPLVPASSGEDSFFGYSVAISGDTAIVGAPAFAPVSQGAAYVFVRKGEIWTPQEPILTAFEPTTPRSSQFGYSVAISGETAVVGAPSSDPTWKGAAYVVRIVAAGGVPGAGGAGGAELDGGSVETGGAPADLSGGSGGRGVDAGAGAAGYAGENPGAYTFDRQGCDCRTIRSPRRDSESAVTCLGLVLTGLLSYRRRHQIAGT
jgi:hypothetical protein